LYVSAHNQPRDGNDVLADAGGVVVPNSALLFPQPGNYDGTDVTGVIFAGHDNVTTTWDTSDSFSDGVGIMVFHRFMFDINDKYGYVYVGGGGSTKK
jgi:hypothetical protein